MRQLGGRIGWGVQSSKDEPLKPEEVLKGLEKNTWFPRLSEIQVSEQYFFSRGFRSAISEIGFDCENLKSSATLLNHFRKGSPGMSQIPKHGNEVSFQHAKE